MKIDKEQLRALAEKSDAEIWETVTQIAGAYGYKLPVNPPCHDDMEKIRGAMRGSEKLNMRDALKLLNSYKKSQR